MLKIFILIAAIALVPAGVVLASADASAHGGGLNAYRCHNDTSTGGYHCH